MSQPRIALPAARRQALRARKLAPRRPSRCLVKASRPLVKASRPFTRTNQRRSVPLRLVRKRNRQRPHILRRLELKPNHPQRQSMRLPVERKASRRLVEPRLVRRVSPQSANPHPSPSTRRRPTRRPNAQARLLQSTLPVRPRNTRLPHIHRASRRSTPNPNTRSRM